MFYDNHVQDTRTYFYSAWQKHLAKQNLNQLETQLLAVILQHPEYHTVLSQSESDYQYHQELGISNPFLHMGLHLALRDQLVLDRPKGIVAVFEGLLHRHEDAHYVEHLCMEQLAQSLWQAQREQRMPDEREYFLACQEL